MNGYKEKVYDQITLDFLLSKKLLQRKWNENAVKQMDWVLKYKINMYNSHVRIEKIENFHKLYTYEYLVSTYILRLCKYEENFKL